MTIEITRSHSLGRAATRRRVEDIAAALSRDLSLSYTWEGDRLVFHRTGITGHIEVNEGSVHVFIKKSRLLPLSESWIRHEVEAVMDQHLG